MSLGQAENATMQSISALRMMKSPALDTGAWNDSAKVGGDATGTCTPMHSAAAGHHLQLIQPDTLGRAAASLAAACKKNLHPTEGAKHCGPLTFIQRLKGETAVSGTV